MKNIYLRTLFFLNSLISILYPFRTVKVLNGQFKMRVSSNNELLRALTFKEKEPETLSWIDNFEKNNDETDLVFYDVGANVGIYSLYASHQHPKASVFAFERDSQSFASLSQNIFINRYKIFPYSFALNNTTGIGKVMMSSMSPGAGACSLEGKYLFMNVNSSDVFEQGVFFVSLNDLIFKFNFPCPNYMKVDVDGIEEKIFEGASEVLKSPSLRGVLVELQYASEKDIETLVGKLSILGLELSGKSDWIASYNGLHSRNYIFSRVVRK